MKTFEQKAKDYYGEVVINKGLIGKAGFGARAIPVYVGEWIVSQCRDHIEFDYIFDNNLHDRWIETDTGWRIIIGRGLDIFQKADDKFTLGFLDQTKRKCKATTITYTRVKVCEHFESPSALLLGLIQNFEIVS